MEGSKFYVTTAIDYTNNVIHIGHAYQKVLADVLARYHRLRGDKTFFLTGTDEYGLTSEQAAKAAGKKPKEFVDGIVTEDKKQLDALNISYDRFIRTTDPDHIKTVREFYLKVKKSEDIYKGNYTGLYCIGCEAYKTKREIVEGHCELHPTRKLEKVSEENYFFRWSKYEKFLKENIRSNPKFIQPETQRKEMLAFLDRGLKDIPISRKKEKVSWGIPVPDDPDQVIYVWFDALINYISGAPDFWPADVHIIGKDNLRWHTLLWPAMLKSAGYDLPKTVYAHGFLSLEGKKISKSLGNIIRPKELATEFGTDAVRYYLARYGPLRKDADISRKHLKEVYNADLANGLGNLVSRIAKLAEGSEVRYKIKDTRNKKFDKYHRTLKNFRFDEALHFIWEEISKLDKFIDQQKPWEKKGEKLKKDLEYLASNIYHLTPVLEPFLPETAEKIKKQFTGKIIPAKPLFPRL